VLLGTTGIGKTWQLKTLAEQTTLFWDLEAGDLTVQDWRGDAIRPRQLVLRPRGGIVALRGSCCVASP